MADEIIATTTTTTTTTPPTTTTTTYQPTAPPTSSDAPTSYVDVSFNFDSTSLRGHSITISLSNDDGSPISIEATKDTSSGTSDGTIQTIEVVEHSQRYIVLYITNILISYKGASTITITYGANQDQSFKFTINWSPDNISTDYGSFQFLSGGYGTLYINENDTSYPLSYICYDTENISIYTSSNLASITNDISDLVFDVNTDVNESTTERDFTIYGQGYSHTSSSLKSLTDTLFVIQYPYNNYYFEVDEYEVQLGTFAFRLATIPATQTQYIFTFTSNAPVIWSPQSSCINCVTSLSYNSDTGLGTCIVDFGEQNTSGIKSAQFNLMLGQYNIYQFEVRQNKVISNGYITFNENNVVYQYNDTSTHSVNFTATNCVDNSYSYSTNNEWIKLNSLTTSGGSGTIEFSLTENDVDSERIGTITIAGQSNGGAYTSTSINIKQLSTLAPIDFPIWKDVDITLTSEDTYVQYQITNNNNVVYNGRAFMMNGKSTIRINDILRDFINENLDLSKEYQIQSNNSHYRFYLNVPNANGVYYPYKQLRTWNDNSYDSSHKYKSGIISQYLNNTVDKRQLFLISVEDYPDNSTSSLNIYGTFQPLQGINETYIFDRTVNINNDVATYVLPASNFLSTISTTFNNDDVKTFTLDDGCKPYCLYWRNIYGGYNYCLFNDATKQTDNITSYDYSVENNNTTISFHKKQYLKEVVETWSIKSDYLTDAQSNIVKFIAHSPEVYLHDLVNDVIKPVLITDTSIDHKLYRNNSRKFVTYTFKLQNSNTKLIQ